MQFTKIKDGQGDYVSYETSVLVDELRLRFGDNFIIRNTDQGGQVNFEVTLLNEADTPENEKLLIELIRGHGSEEEVAKRLDQNKKDVHNQVIYKSLNDLDMKCIRALRAGEIDYIDKYEKEAVELRSQLQS
jgi:hypothetical protein